MGIKNPTDFLVEATQLPATIEGALPAGAPALSATLVDVATKLPALPDLPIELPDLPAIPALPAGPELPAFPGAPELPNAGLGLPGRAYVKEVQVTPVAAPGAVAARGVTPVEQRYIPSPAVGVIPQVVTRRGI